MDCIYHAPNSCEYNLFHKTPSAVVVHEVRSGRYLERRESIIDDARRSLGGVSAAVGIVLPGNGESPNNLLGVCLASEGEGAGFEPIELGPQFGELRRVLADVVLVGAVLANEVHKFAQLEPLVVDDGEASNVWRVDSRKYLGGTESAATYSRKRSPCWPSRSGPRSCSARPDTVCEYDKLEESAKKYVHGRRGGELHCSS